MEFWNVPVEWPGETVFIIAGGPSVAAHDLSRLRGRKVIVVNSSYEAAPFADLCFFGDHRWYMEHAGRPAFRNFKGRMATVSKASPGPNLLKLRRMLPPPGLVRQTNAAVSQRTSLQGAMNVACHLTGWTGNIVLIGADMGRDPAGKTHHHLPHRWKNKPGNKTWDIQMAQLIHVVPVLKEAGIRVINVGMNSRIPWFQKMPTLADAIKCSS
jgi:hypothetical protein